MGGPETEANSTGVQLLGILVVNKMPPFNPDTAGSLEEKRWVSEGGREGFDVCDFGVCFLYVLYVCI